MKLPSELLIIIAILLLIIGVSGWYFAILRKRRKDKAVRKAIELKSYGTGGPNGLVLPVLETLAGWKRLKLLTFAQNSFNPKFTLFPNEMRYKVFFKRSARYDQIETVEYVASHYFNKARFLFNHTSLTLSVVFTGGEPLQAVLVFLQEKGVTTGQVSV